MGMARSAQRFDPLVALASYRIPAEDIARALERRERGAERALELLVEGLRRPALGAMNRADRARLVEQENLVAAHAENLSRDGFGAVGGEIDDERRDLFRGHLAEPLDPPLLLLGRGGDRVDHAGPGERSDAVRPDLEARHVERDR